MYSNKSTISHPNKLTCQQANIPPQQTCPTAQAGQRKNKSTQNKSTIMFIFA